MGESANNMLYLLVTFMLIATVSHEKILHAEPET